MLNDSTLALQRERSHLEIARANGEACERCRICGNLDDFHPIAKIGSVGQLPAYLSTLLSRLDFCQGIAFRQIKRAVREIFVNTYDLHAHGNHDGRAARIQIEAALSQLNAATLSKFRNTTAYPAANGCLSSRLPQRFVQVPQSCPPGATTTWWLDRCRESMMLAAR